MRLRGSHFALLTIASFVLLFVYSLFQLVNIDHAFREELVERNLWAANQADREAQNLMLTLYRVSLDRDVEDVLLRFDILYSRIALMADRPQIDYFREIGAGDLVAQARSLLEELDAAFQAQDFDPTDVAVLMPRVVVLASVLREITNATALEERLARHVRREALLRVMQLLLLAVGGAFLTGVVMAGLLWRNMRRAMRAQAELQEHRAELERTVAARTTELQEALEVERRAKEVYRSFIVTVSHQFRTPVSIIHMIAQRQLRDEETPLSETLRRKFSRILDAAERLERLLSGFLASASVEGKDIALSRRIVDFNQIARIAAEQTRQANPGRVLEVALSETPLQADADPVLLEQAVLNLLSNAMKYSEAPSPVSLETWRDGGRIFCRVKDRGAGIPPGARGAVFDRFYRAPNVHRLPGVGVGLSLVRDIVALHGGEVTFTSRLGEGSEFVVAVPAKGEQDDESAARAGDHSLCRG
ncbi:sensor histidine kinase [Paracoccus pantotrophus]|uniref:sensor histidine kinase n=1 Tax=Paracoccus pantotrophus TaxID=82367 RepID=UPI000E09AAC1|nr:HAMP domain-containing sensor histidine kinase [Paracoccus pantotrophus]RDD95178.1 sensor histidine kinase [Paracoccus pantotrophus]WGR65863.1 HAMP domain-containing histidine kinase [Paracoccus pantotrophus]